MNNILRKKIIDTCQIWHKTARPSRQAFLDLADNLIKWKQKTGIQGLWDTPPLMLTATIDDAWGHGLEIIQTYAKAAGINTLPLGLLQSPETIIAECQNHVPHILGMTILQFDSEDSIAYIRKKIPSKTLIVAGGPLFRADPELAQRMGIDFVAKDAVAFMEFLLDFKP